MSTTPHPKPPSKPITTPTINLYSTSPDTQPPRSSRRSTFQLADFFTWTDEQLEYKHDYIQHVFPLPEVSAFHLLAPTLTLTDRLYFLSSPEPRDLLRRVLIRMAHFYGFRTTPTDPSTALPTTTTTTTLEFSLEKPVAACRHWFTAFGHNHLRITRIIRSCRILGLEVEARAFYRALIDADEANGGLVGDGSKEFWRRAAEEDLAQPPDPRDDEVDWLRA